MRHDLPIVHGALYGGDRVVLYNRRGRSTVLHHLLDAAKRGRTAWIDTAVAPTDVCNVVLLRRPTPDELVRMSKHMGDRLTLLVATDVDHAMAKRYAEDGVAVGPRQALLVQLWQPTKGKLPAEVTYWPDRICHTTRDANDPNRVLMQNLRAPRYTTTRPPWPVAIDRTLGPAWA